MQAGPLQALPRTADQEADEDATRLPAGSDQHRSVQGAGESSPDPAISTSDEAAAGRQEPETPAPLLVDEAVPGSDNGKGAAPTLEIVPGPARSVEASDNGDHAAAVESEEQPASTAKQPCLAWIMHGDISRALYQAGLAEVLLEKFGPPAVVYSGGTSILNALMLANGRSEELTRGWEKLRAQHILFDTALEHAPLLAPRGREASRLVGFVENALDYRDTDQPLVELQMFCGEHYSALPSGSAQPGSMRVATVSLTEQNSGALPWERAIRHLLASRVDRVLLLGVDDAVSRSLELEQAIRTASERNIKVSVIGFDSGERPGLLDYLLPGSGSPERLMRDGREAALSWFDDEEFDTAVAT